MGVGDRIRRARIARGISATELGEMIGKNRSTIYRYENGEVGGARVGVLEPIAAALGTTPAALMGWTNEWDEPEIIDTSPTPPGGPGRRLPIMELHEPPNPIINCFLKETPESYSSPGDYVVQAVGDAMAAANIRQGDYVFINQQNDAADGELALFIINRSLAIMRVFHTQSGTTLVSENPNIPPIMLEKTPSARLLGRVVGFHRAL